MQGPLGGADPVLLKGLARAPACCPAMARRRKRLFLQLKEIDPAAFDADVELDYARALEAAGQE